VVLRTPLGRGTGRLKAYSGIARQKILTKGVEEDLSGSRVTGGFLDYQDLHWTARIGIADLRVLHEFSNTLFDVLKTIRSFASIQTDPSWQATCTRLPRTHRWRASMWCSRVSRWHMRMAAASTGALSQFAPRSLVFPLSYSGYLSVGYRYGKFTPYAAIAAVKNRKIHRADDLAGKGIGLDPLLSIMNYMFTSGERNQRTYTWACATT